MDSCLPNFSGFFKVIACICHLFDVVQLIPDNIRSQMLLQDE